VSTALLDRDALPEAPPLDLLQTKSFESTSIVGMDDETGVIEAVVAGIGNKDSVGDIIEPGAFAESLVRRRPKACWSHDWNIPIGRTLDARELRPGDPLLPPKMKMAGVGGLYVKTQFNLNTTWGKDAYETVKFFNETGEAEWCADAETEILTGRGWLRYDEVTTDDEAYVLDPQTLVARFEPIQAINTWEAKPRVLRHIETGNFSALTTAAHRWLVTNEQGTAWAWRETRDLDRHQRIMRAAPRDDAPAEPKWADAFVELVAWYWCEGWRTDKGFALIGQSARVSPGHVAAIRRAADAAFPGGWTEQQKADGMVHFRLRRDQSDALFEVTDADTKAPTTEFLRSLTVSQLRLFIERCLDGDGHRGGTYRRWYQVDGRSVRRFEMACALAGIATNTYQPPDYGNRFGRVPMLVTLLASDIAKPLDAVRVASYQSKRKSPATDSLVRHDGIVWCPTTPSNTWLARRRGTVYFTGNSIGYLVLDAEYDKKAKANRLKTVELYEYSPVLFGANPLTGTVSVKSANAQRIEVKVPEGLRDTAVARKIASGVLAALSDSDAFAEKVAVPKGTGALSPHSTPTDASRPWDSGPAESNLPSGGDGDEQTLRQAYAWLDPDGDPDVKASYKFIHHFVSEDGTVGAASVKACQTGIGVLNGGRGGTTIPDSDREGVYAHLAKHLEDAEVGVPDLKTAPTVETKAEGDKAPDAADPNPRDTTPDTADQQAAAAPADGAPLTDGPDKNDQPPAEGTPPVGEPQPEDGVQPPDDASGDDVAGTVAPGADTTPDPAEAHAPAASGGDETAPDPTGTTDPGDGTTVAPEELAAEHTDDGDLGTKSAAGGVPGEKAVAGSLEARIDTIRRALSEAHKGAWCYPVATFESSVVYIVEEQVSPGGGYTESGYFQASYSIDADGKVKVGESNPVDLVEVIVAKGAGDALRGVIRDAVVDYESKALDVAKGGHAVTASDLDSLDIKAGRVLSSKNRAKLETAIASIQAVLEDAQPTVEVKDPEKKGFTLDEVREGKLYVRALFDGDLDDEQVGDALEAIKAKPDPTKPHKFVPRIDDASKCLICGGAKDDDIHDAAAKADNPSLTDPHEFVDDNDDGKCDICGQGSDAAVHQGKPGSDMNGKAQKDPEKPHDFVTRDDGERGCAVCGGDRDRDVHVRPAEKALLTSADITEFELLLEELDA
jgi:hypothetical protein